MGSFQINIVYFGDQWDDMWRRRQQLAFRLTRFPRVNAVVYVEQPLPLTSLAKYLVRRADFDGMARWSRVLCNAGFVQRPFEKLYIITPITLLPFSNSTRLMTVEMNFRYWMQVRVVRKVLAKIGDKNLVLGLSFPFLPLGLIREFHPSITWYDCTENFDTYGTSTIVQKISKDQDNYLVKVADLVTVVHSPTYEQKRMVNSTGMVYYLPNGVDIQPFLELDLSGEPDDLRPIQRPRLACVASGFGNQHAWEVLEYVAQARPNWSIVLIGNVTLRAQILARIKKHPSIHFLGAKPFEEVPRYLEHVDVCIQLYTEETERSSKASPQKTWLYLASGKPIVYFRFPDKNNFGGLIRITDSPKTFIDYVEMALAEHSPQLVERRKALARENSWDIRAKQVYNGLIYLLDRKNKNV